MTANNWTFVIAAYMAAWVAILGYWVFVHGAVHRARERYEQALAAALRAEERSR